MLVDRLDAVYAMWMIMSNFTGIYSLNGEF